MNIPLDLKKIESALKEAGLNPHFQKETKQLYLVYQWEQLEFPLFIKVGDEKKTLQILVFFPGTIKDKQISDMSRLLHMLNKEIDIPGFGLDEGSALAFYRTVLPAFKEVIPEETLTAYLTAIPVICQTYAGAILGLAKGTLTLDKILKSKPAKV